MGLSKREAKVGCWRPSGMERVYQRAQRPVGALDMVIRLKSSGTGGAA